MAVEIVDRLDDDFADSSGGVRLHTVRVSTFDAAVRRFLGPHPAGMVVALGEGLETQFWRLDNGRVRWLTVDLPETMELRRRLLPDGPRQSSHSGSALDLGWVDGLSPADPILVTAQGLFPYFQRYQVHGLIAAIAQRLPGSVLVFDVVPEVMREMARRASGRERDLAVQLWAWLFNDGDRAAISAIPAPRIRKPIPSRGAARVSIEGCGNEVGQRPLAAARKQDDLAWLQLATPVGRTQLRRAAGHNQQLLVGVMKVVGTAEHA